MSGLAHVLEEAGIATVIVALVRPHAEKMRPPRTLWVPYQLGRPLGTPGNEALQLATLRAALALFDSVQTTAQIVDFNEEQTDLGDDPTWTPPPVDAPDIRAEIAALAPAQTAAVAALGRSTVGVSGLDVNAAASYLQALLENVETASPVDGQGAAAVMRFAADDLKAWYFEAAMTTGSLPSTEQLGAWFWQHTQAGQLIRRLRARATQAGDATLRTVAASSLVPREWAERLD